MHSGIRGFPNRDDALAYFDSAYLDRSSPRRPTQRRTTMLTSLREKFSARFRAIEQRCSRMQEALGRIESRQLSDLKPHEIQSAEFSVYSQWGEDGILQHLLRYVPISNKVFVEFGVENYLEANTRFLMVKDKWTGLVMDGSEVNIDYIKQDDISWRFNLKAQQAFITRENINDLIRANGISGEIGLLSIDIDGNDYWVWEAIDVVAPTIVIVEYNHRFGSERAVAVPYRADFQRSKAHHSYIYYCASLAALCRLGNRKGYAFVGCTTAGNDAFFIRRELKPDAIPELTPAAGFAQGKFRESRDEKGRLAFLDEAQEAAILAKLAVVEIS